MRKQNYAVWAAFDTIVTIEVLYYSRYHFESPNRDFYQKRDFIEVRKTTNGQKLIPGVTLRLQKKIVVYKYHFLTKPCK